MYNVHLGGPLPDNTTTPVGSIRPKMPLYTTERWFFFAAISSFVCGTFFAGAAGFPHWVTHCGLTSQPADLSGHPGLSLSCFEEQLDIFAVGQICS